MDLSQTYLRYLPTVIGIFIYRGIKNKKLREKGYVVERILNNSYQDILLRNANGARITLGKVKETPIGYEVIYKLPLGYSIEKLKNLSETLENCDSRHSYMVEEFSDDAEKDVSNKYLRISMIDNSKAEKFYNSKIYQKKYISKKLKKNANRVS